MKKRCGLITKLFLYFLLAIMHDYHITVVFKKADGRLFVKVELKLDRESLLNVVTVSSNLHNR